MNENDDPRLTLVRKHLGCSKIPGMALCAKHRSEGWPCSEAARVAAALAPLIEERAVAAEASSLRKVARWLRDLGHNHLADVLDIKADQSLGACPACGAKPGARCLTRSGKRRGRPHDARTNPKEKP